MFDRLTGTFSDDRVAGFVDAPNIIRREFDVDLDDLRNAFESLGRLKRATVYLNQHAPDKLIEAIVSQGFDPQIGLAGNDDESKDVDVLMAVEAVETIYTDSIDILALATRDTDFLPVIQKAKEYDIKTAIICVDEGLSTALKNAADQTIQI